jgi:hypothetical protein
MVVGSSVEGHTCQFAGQRTKVAVNHKKSYARNSAAQPEESSKIMR